MRTASIALIVLFITALASAVHAQPSPPPADDATAIANRDRARELAREAAALFQSGNRRAAVAKFEEAYKLFPTPALLYNIGKAYAGLSEYVRAHNALSEFLRQTVDSDTDFDRRAEAQSILADVAPHVGVATITAPTFAGAIIHVDGIRLGTAPLEAPIAIAPGVHEVTAIAAPDDHLVARKRVTVAGGGRIDIELTKIEDEFETVIVTKEVPSRPVYKRWWFWTAIGATVASSAAIYIATHPREVNDAGNPPLGSLGLDDFTRR
jgi:hypothetical protein